MPLSIAVNREGAPMPRKTFTAALLDETGQVLAADTKYAFNSTIKASEALVRAWAREREVYCHGGRPTRQGDIYTRQWIAESGEQLTAHVSPA